MALPVVVRSAGQLVTATTAAVRSAPRSPVVIEGIAARTGMTGLNSGNVVARTVAWMRGNPVRAGIVATALTGAGVTVGAGVADYLQNNEFGALPGAEAVAQAFAEATARAQDATYARVGDGNPDTVLGAARDEFIKDVGALEAQFEMIKVGIRVCGSLAEFQRFQMALLAVEPEAIAAFQRLRR